MPQPRSDRSRSVTLGIFAVTGAAVVGMIVALRASERYRNAWAHDTWSRPILVVQAASVAAAIAGGLLLVNRRPRNRCGYVALAIGVVFGAWFVAVFRVDAGHGWALVPGAILLWTFRPLLFWLVLAYPIGRLDRPSRRLYFAFLAFTAVEFTVSILTAAGDASWPLDVFHESTWTLLFTSIWWDVASLFWLTMILVVVQRRRLRFRGASAQGLLDATWYAALVATGGDFVLIATGPLRDLMAHDGGLTPFGTVIQLWDYARWGVVVATLAVAAMRSWPRDATSAASVDIDPAALDETLRTTLVQSLGDASADVAIADGHGGWLDGQGVVRPAPASTATPVLRDGVTVAALEHDEGLVAHPALLDAAVAAVALQVEARHQAALAGAREHELRALARDMLEADDQARRQLERDLHDGAQQLLVGLTLQAALTARRNDDPRGAGRELADAVDDARDELERIASGRPPALLVERGLDGAIGALVLTAGLPVRVVADSCSDLPDSLQRAIWFVASEAVTNSLKHARAHSLDLSLRRTDHRVTLVVRDDGRGGVEQPPRTLAARVDEAGGRLEIESNGHGTLVRAEFAAVER